MDIKEIAIQFNYDGEDMTFNCKPDEKIKNICKKISEHFDIDFGKLGFLLNGILLKKEDFDKPIKSFVSSFNPLSLGMLVVKFTTLINESNKAPKKKENFDKKDNISLPVKNDIQNQENDEVQANEIINNQNKNIHIENKEDNNNNTQLKNYPNNSSNINHDTERIQLQEVRKVHIIFKFNTDSCDYEYSSNKNI